VLLKLRENGIMRFNELYKLIPSISEKMLSTALRSLETDGLVHRKVYPEVPPRVEYYVSDFGMTLIPHLENIIQWGQENFSTIMDNRKKKVT
jgi:DNA-binding HxlR family transcriptional regulator